MNGFVFADINIVRVVVDRQIASVRNVRKILILAGCNYVDLAVLCGFFRRFLRPGAGDDIVRNAVLHEIHRNHGKLQRCSALNEEHFVIVRNVHQFAKIRFRFVYDGLVNLGTVRHFHDAHTAAMIVQHLSGDFLQHLNGHRCGTCRKIVDSIVLHTTCS
ncbi:hypothetical protein SDC9_67811 [bioreactor metagenome]|uniref:Uncharacterized protein n=1 Tax=bioreactor metagenome TaxID=1076179 RepID=A0A644XZN7_9ZZZZ